MALSDDEREDEIWEEERQRYKEEKLRRRIRSELENEPETSSSSGLGPVQKLALIALLLLAIYYVLVEEGLLQ